MAKGITGTGRGFDLPGRRLGGFSRQPPLSSLRHKALTAAESRAQKEAPLPSGPKRLGGDTSIKSALSPIQAAAMAAERRLQDDVWCGSKSMESEGSSGSSKAPVILQERSTQSSTCGSLRIRGRGVTQAAWECSSCTLLNGPLGLICEACETPKHKGNGANYLKIWACKFCTLDNSITVERCMACGEWRYSYGPPVSTPGYLGT